MDAVEVDLSSISGFSREPVWLLVAASEAGAGEFVALPGFCRDFSSNSLVLMTGFRFVFRVACNWGARRPALEYGGLALTAFSAVFTNLLMFVASILNWLAKKLTSFSLVAAFALAAAAARLRFSAAFTHCFHCRTALVCRR
jgi:hypothetical protein